MNEAELKQHRSVLKWQKDHQLWHSYRTYLDGLSLDAHGMPPKAAKLQFFVETWREMRRRLRERAKP